MTTEQPKKRAEKVSLELTTCKDCPFLETERYYTADSWEHVTIWYCGKSDRPKPETSTAQAKVSWSSRIALVERPAKSQKKFHNGAHYGVMTMFLRIMSGMAGLGTGMAIAGAIFEVRQNFFASLGMGILCGALISILAYGLFNDLEDKPKEDAEE